MSAQSAQTLSQSSGRKTILLVEDTVSLARTYETYLEKQTATVISVETGRAAKEIIQTQPVDVVLLDLKLPDMDGMDILKWISESQIPVHVIVITAHGSVNVAVESMRYGAYDFIVKPFTADRLNVTVKNALETASLKHMLATYKEEFSRTHYHGFVGSSLAMEAVYRIIDSAAASKATVFITGESGTGKEVCAEAIHKQSPRRDKPFIALNCGAIPKDLIESEIFGHVKGAFTGATADRDGAAAMAEGGTLFLDEICEMDLNLQTKLLRFIQTGTFQRVGGSKQEKADIRILCATNRDPLKEVEDGRFREDLYYRLHVIPIHLPPLREREGDVVEIARAFLESYAQEEGKTFNGFDDEAEKIIRIYDWPGNVRQLQNVIRNIVVLHDGAQVSRDMLPPPLNNLAALPDKGRGSEGGHGTTPTVMPPAPAPVDATQIKPLWLVEKETIEAAIEACDGNVPKAAALLDISPSTIYRKKIAWEERENGQAV